MTTVETVVVANPFPGLRPFEPSESHLFFGRDEQVDELLVRIQRLRFLAVVGTSGCGKSSLIRAGLLPALHRGCLPASGSRWRVAVFRPGDAPICNLATALATPEGLGPGHGQDPAADLEATLRRSSLGLVQAVHDSQMPPKHNLLVVVDQFEEVFTFKKLFDRSGGEEPAAFVKLLLAAAEQVAVPISVVLTMRSDFLGDCAQFAGLPEALNDAQYLVPRLTRDQRQECIEGPVAVGGASITPRLVQRLLNDVGDDPDQLPILQHALTRTWEASREDREQGRAVDLDHYLAVGGMANALDRHAEEAFADLRAADQEIAPRVFRCLTERGPDGRETRRPQRLATLALVAGAAEPRVQSVIAPFHSGGRTFLTMSGKDVLVDISHESLIRLWKRLSGWVQDEAKAAATYRRLADTARRWQAGNASLYEAAELKEALMWKEATRPTATWASRYDPDLDLALRFLKASRSSRRRLWVAALGGLATVLAILAGVAVFQWKRAESGELAALSLVSLRTDPERSVRLALRAAEKTETKASDDALREALAVSVVRKLWSVPLDRAAAVVFSPEGRRLAAGSSAGEAPGRVGIWDVGTGQLLSSVCGYDIASLHWTADGVGLLLRLNDDRLMLWNAAGRDVAPVMTTLVAGGDEGQVEDLDVRPDGKEVAVAVGTKGLLRFDTSLGTRTGPPWARPKAPLAPDVIGPKDEISSVAYSLDGRLLAAASKGTVAVVDSSSGRLLCRTPPLPDEVEILRVGFSGPHPGRVGASSFDNALRSWPVHECGSDPVRFLGHREVMDFAFTNDGDYLVSASHDGTLRLWDSRTGEEVFSRRMVRYDAMRRTVRYQFNRVATDRSRASPRGTPDRTHVATVGDEPEEGDSMGETLTLWDIAPRREAETLKALTSERATASGPRLQDLVRRARDLRVEPRLLRDQVPDCGKTRRADLGR